MNKWCFNFNEKVLSHILKSSLKVISLQSCSEKPESPVQNVFGKGCVAAASVLESWIGLAPQKYAYCTDAFTHTFTGSCNILARRF